MEKLKINNFDKITQHLINISDNMKNNTEIYTVKEDKNFIEAVFKKCIDDILNVYIHYIEGNGQVIRITLKDPMAYIYNVPIHKDKARIQGTIDYVISKLDEDLLIEGEYFD